MFESFKKKLSVNAKNLINQGYVVLNVEDKERLSFFRDQFIMFLLDNYQIKIKKLENFHNHINGKDLNEIRYGFFKYLNGIEDIVEQYLTLGRESIFDIVGNELACNRTLNFSIQMPGDDSSLLPMHSDTFSGESEFQINLWAPLVDSYDTNSMFIFNPDFSKTIQKNIEKYETTGLDNLLNKHPDEYKFINVKYGEILIFTPTCLHGNTINKTKHTRISFNCRYKNIFSPYNQNEENEKKLGSFYKPITLKAASIIGFQHKLGK